MARVLAAGLVRRQWMRSQALTPADLAVPALRLQGELHAALHAQHKMHQELEAVEADNAMLQKQVRGRAIKLRAASCSVEPAQPHASFLITSHCCMPPAQLAESQAALAAANKACANAVALVSA